MPKRPLYFAILFIFRPSPLHAFYLLQKSCLPCPSTFLSAPIRQSITIAARRVEGTRPTPAHLSHILRHPLARLPAIGASYAIHIPRRMSFRSEISIRRALLAAAAWILNRASWVFMIPCLAGRLVGLSTAPRSASLCVCIGSK